MYGRYAIEREDGDTIIARDPELERRVSIRFMPEGATKLAQLRHRNVVEVYDVGEHDGRTFVATALIEGTPLQRWLATPRATADIVRVLAAAATGLAAAHAAGVAHGALTADRIVVGRDVVVVDFTGSGDPESDRRALADIARDALADRRIPSRVREALERGEPAHLPGRRRWLWPAAIAAGAIVLVAWPRHGDRCASTAHELDDIAATTGYAHDWLAMRRDACLANDEPKLRCLDRARDALREVAGNPRAAAALPSLDDCAAPVETPVSADGDQLLRSINAESIRVALGGVDRSAAAHALTVRAEASGYEPAIVEARIVEASATNNASLLRSALAAAEASHDDVRVTRVATTLAQASIDAGKLDDARAMVELARAALARSMGATQVEVELTDVRARLAAATGDHEGAIELASSLIAPMTERAGADSLEVAALHIMLAREYGALNRPADAARELAAARVDNLAHAPGIDVAIRSAAVAEAIGANDGPRAIALAREFVALARELHEPAVEAEAAQALADAYATTLDDRGIVDANAALLALPDLTPHVRAAAFEALGRAWLDLGEPTRAVEPLQHAVELEPDAVDRAFAAACLADALLATGKPGDARAVVEPAVRVLGDARDVPSQYRARAEFALARTLTDNKARAMSFADQAARDYREAIDTLRNYPTAVARLQRRLDAVTAWRSPR